MFPRRFFLFATTPLGPLWTSFIIFSFGHQYRNVGNVRDNFPNVHLSGFTHPKLWSNMLKVLTSLLKRGLHHKLRNCLQIAEDNFSSKTMLTRSNLINLDHNHLGLSQCFGSCTQEVSWSNSIVTLSNNKRECFCSVDSLVTKVAGEL